MTHSIRKRGKIEETKHIPIRHPLSVAKAYIVKYGNAYQPYLQNIRSRQRRPFHAVRLSEHDDRLSDGALCHNTRGIRCYSSHPCTGDDS